MILFYIYYFSGGMGGLGHKKSLVFGGDRASGTCFSLGGGGAVGFKLRLYAVRGVRAAARARLLRVSRLAAGPHSPGKG